MEQSINKNRLTPKIFIITGLVLLVTGMFWGLMGGLQYILPGFLRQILSFEKVRPLHVSSVVFWIILSASGSVFTYMQQHTGSKIYSQKLLKIQFFLFTGSILLILISYCAGIFGGREYWEFHPALAFPIIVSWILFVINFTRSLKVFKSQPVYVWMWLTGIIFFLFTFLESYLWIFPYFRNNVVNDMTIQWKSYGSMVGAWNMMIYGCSLFLMDKISNNKKYSTSGIAYVLYFTGLFNLMFNWGHHIYTLPTHNYIKHISYAVSMTELFILGRIIYKWKDSISIAKKHVHLISYRFLIAADAWIFLTLLLAIAMSIPAINIYTHGTHITVAHTMGATIGINTFLLLAIAFDILKDNCRSFEPNKKIFNKNFWVANVSLLIFWLSLIIAGIIKAKWQMSNSQIPFSNMMHQLRPFFILFFISGLTLFGSIVLVVVPVLKNHWACFFNRRIKSKTEEVIYTKTQYAFDN